MAISAKVNNTVLGRKFDKIPFLNWNIVTDIYKIMDARSFGPSSIFSILGKLTLQFIFLTKNGEVLVLAIRR